jgi:REP element-mobilizing transposase RayT
MFANFCTDFELELDYPIIRNKLRVESLWSPSYFAESCGSTPISVIYKYI